MSAKYQESLLFGIHAISEKLRSSPQEITELLLSRGLRGPSVRFLEEQARLHRRSVSYVDPNVLGKICGGGKHQGAVARVIAFAYGTLNELLGGLTRCVGDHTVLCLDGVTDQGNLGNILRTAEAMGVQDVILPKNRTGRVTPMVAKASAGAVNHLRIYRIPNLCRGMMELKTRGYWTVGLEPQAAERAYEREYPEKLVVVLGAEGSGLRPLVRSQCDYLISLPMAGQIGSLNVAVAGAMFLYELLRQRRRK